MTDELEELHLAPEEDKEVRRLLVTMSWYYERTEDGDREHMPPDVQQKFDRLREILGEPDAEIGRLLKFLPDDTTFFVGDSDLYFLGLAAALAARWQMIRKGGKHPIPAPELPQNDVHAMVLLVAGIALGGSVPLDDVPKLYVEIKLDRATFRRLRTLADDGVRDLGKLLDKEEGDGEEGDGDRLDALPDDDD